MNAEQYFNENKNSIEADFLLRAKDEKPDLIEDNQVIFFGLCYQDSDMNGDYKYCANYDNDGADYGFCELIDTIEKDYPKLVDETTYHSRYWVEQMAHNIALEFFDAFKIKTYFSREED
jgi:hypothetical protein